MLDEWSWSAQVACWGHLNPDAMREEALSPEERLDLQAEGYISGATVRQPAVMCFNAVIANLAVVEVLRLLAGFGQEHRILRLGASFSTGCIKPNILQHNELCSICRMNQSSPH